MVSAFGGNASLQDAETVFATIPTNRCRLVRSLPPRRYDRDHVPAVSSRLSSQWGVGAETFEEAQHEYVSARAWGVAHG